MVNVLDGRAANVFESTLRAICMTVEGLSVVPQMRIGTDRALGPPDLVDVENAIVIEADSFAWHGGRGALVRDARRYNEFAVAGWMVLRFSWEDVMLHPERVRMALVQAVERRRGPRRLSA